MQNAPHFGLIGLGTMGAALALNIAENGYPIAVFNRTASVTDAFIASAGDLAAQLTPAKTLEEFVAAIRPPRAIILMVPAGPVVDDQIARLRPLLEAGDLIIDAGNANYTDTERRAQESRAESQAVGHDEREQLFQRSQMKSFFLFFSAHARFPNILSIT